MKLKPRDVNTIKVSMHKDPETLACEIGVAKEWVREKMNELRECEKIRRLVS